MTDQWVFFILGFVFGTGGMVLLRGDEHNMSLFMLLVVFVFPLLLVLKTMIQSIRQRRLR